METPETGGRSEGLRQLSDSRILIIDDDTSNVLLLSEILRANGFPAPRAVNDPREAVGAFLECKPDLVVLDLRMPHLDGFTLAGQLRSKIPRESYLPILVLTGDGSIEAKRRLLAAGADDFLTKPFDSIEVLLRIRHLLEIRGLYLQLQRQKQVLEEMVQERTRDLEEARDEVMERLALAAEYRDDQTARHNQRVGMLSERLALCVGLARDEAKLIGRAALLHDLGKVGVSDSVLRKPGQLEEEEFEAIKPHTVIGAGILSGSRSQLLQLAEVIALYHHERWDGNGYAGIAGAEIPLPARIVAVADAFDAMTHDRPYREAGSVARAIAVFQEERARQFDPQLVDALTRLHESGELARFVDSSAKRKRA